MFDLSFGVFGDLQKEKTGMDMPREIALIYRNMTAELNSRFSKFGSSYSQVGILKALSDCHQLTQSQICQEQGLDKSTITKTLEHLKKEGLITKSRNPEDTRSYLVSLTQKGEELVQKTAGITQEWTDEVTSGMTEIEKDAFLKLLEKASEETRKIRRGSSHMKDSV